MSKSVDKWSLEDCTTYLGKPSEYITDNDDLVVLRRWAVLNGTNPLDAWRMSTVELANLYHASAGENKHTCMTAEDIEKIVARLALKAGDVRNIIAEEMEAYLSGVITRDKVEQIASERATLIADRIGKTIIEHMTPKRIELITPMQTFNIEGSHFRTAMIAQIVTLGHPVMMVGPAGAGKTTIAETVARIMQLPFYITSTINDTHELTGFIDGYGKYHSTPFRNAFEHGGVWVADEIDAWDASALLAANAALANGYANFPDCNNPILRNPNFRMVATANTFGAGADRVYIGRNQLDAASLDRFAMVEIDYDMTLEKQFSNGNIKWLDHVWATRRKVNEFKIRHVISSRAIIMGGKALAAGMEWSDVENIYLYKGMSESDRKKLQ